MDTQRDPNDSQALNQEVQAIWNKNASFWDSAMGEGNQFQRVLIGPAAERLLELKPGALVLDVACGNGVFSRRMAQLGAQVVACDFSATFIQRAQERGSEYAAQITYVLIDATNREQLVSLAKHGKFDAIYCGMAIQDMTEIDPLFSALPELLKLGGRFVFSVPHPAFNSSYIRTVIEEGDREGELVVQYAIKVTGYSQPLTCKGLGIIGQPAAHYYFHRPISLLYNSAFKYGLVLNGIEEPTFGPDDVGDHPFSWANYKDIPPVLISRMTFANV